MNIQEQIKGLEFFVDHFGAFSEEGQMACGAIDTLEKLYAENERLVEMVQEAYETEHRASFQDWLDMNGYRLSKEQP